MPVLALSTGLAGMAFQNLPFSEEIVEFHKEKIAERAREQDREISYEAVIKDITSISEGQLVRQL